jgi:hypothetical protein
VSDFIFNWFEGQAKLVIEQKTQESLNKAAFRIEERTKVNINEAPGASGQGLIDTAFMLNSTYVAMPNRSTYDKTLATGLYANREGADVERHIAPEVPFPNGAAALVAVGAEYAVYQEIIHHFFYQAILDAASEFDGLVEKF